MNPKKIGRPTNNPRTNRFEIRLSDKELDKLNKCSKELEQSRTDVIVKGIELVEKTLNK